MITTFSQRVTELALSIPPCRVTTYGILARGAGGCGQAARSVSYILSKFSNQGMIPWHRIVYSSGHAWLSPEHEAKRRKQYKKEGIGVDKKGKIKDFEEILYHFD
ncbi:MAG: MGMT family protein [Candidatus Pacebacteria bacterium]|nr:MGMT family protein [Candidatus Paceibacterota bacterium]